MEEESSSDEYEEDDEDEEDETRGSRPPPAIGKPVMAVGKSICHVSPAQSGVRTRNLQCCGH